MSKKQKSSTKKTAYKKNKTINLLNKVNKLEALRNINREFMGQVCEQ